MKNAATATRSRGARGASAVGRVAAILAARASRAATSRAEDPRAHGADERDLGQLLHDLGAGPALEQRPQLVARCPPAGGTARPRPSSAGVRRAGRRRAATRSSGWPSTTVERAVRRVVAGEHRPVDAVADRADQRVQRGDALVVGGVAHLGQALAQPDPLAHRQQVRDRVGVRGRQHAEGERRPPALRPRASACSPAPRCCRRCGVAVSARRRRTVTAPDALRPRPRGSGPIARSTAAGVRSRLRMSPGAMIGQAALRASSWASS